MTLFPDQFREIVTELLDKHISRDPSVEMIDREWEDGKFTEALADRLRTNGINVPRMACRANDR